MLQIVCHRSKPLDNKDALNIRFENKLSLYEIFKIQTALLLLTNYMELSSTREATRC
jgi:hypothetical protein